MNANINKTKKHLTIVFSAIVFVVIFVLWITFFITRYYKEIHIEKTEITAFSKIIESKQIDINTLWDIFPKFENFGPNGIWKWSKPKRDDEFMPKEFINFILIDSKNTVLFSNIKENIWDDFLLNIINNDKYLELNQDDSYFIKKIKLDDWSTFIVFKKMRYDFYDFVEDILWFTFISILFSIVIYIIWFRFVNKIFIPVEENIKDMSDFIHNAWHELKTPISVIDSNIQLLKEMKTYDESMVSELKNEVSKLNSLIDSLVKLSDIDVFKDVEKVNLKDLVEEILNDFKLEIEKKSLKISTKIKANIYVNSNKNYVYIYISNLIWNAIKYNNEKWEINITYKWWVFSIQDNWLWIKKEDINKIWDRFFKSDTSRNTPWFGIWLSLVKKIWDIYWWEIQVESELDKWTKFNIKF